MSKDEKKGKEKSDIIIYIVKNVLMFILVNNILFSSHCKIYTCDNVGREALMLIEIEVDKFFNVHKCSLFLEQTHSMHSATC